MIGSLLKQLWTALGVSIRYRLSRPHANYWPGWRDSANSFLDFCKDLVELMHAHYWDNRLPPWQAEAASGASLALQVPRWLAT